MRIIYIYSANLPNPCSTDEPSVKNFPIPTETIWCAQEVYNNLVSRYSTFAAHHSLWNKSYGTFPGCSHSNLHLVDMAYDRESFVQSIVAFLPKNINELESHWDQMRMLGLDCVRRGPSANFERQKFRLDVNKIHLCQQLIQRDLAALTSIFSWARTHMYRYT